jgi:hypothetical protein
VSKLNPTWVTRTDSQVPREYFYRWDQSTPGDSVSVTANSGHELDVTSEGVDAEVVDHFSSTVRYAHQVISLVPQFADVPSTKVKTVITSDFVTTVQRVLDDSGQQSDPYAVERLGGCAVAKTMRTSNDYSAYTVVFDAAQWSADSNPLSPLGLLLAAHEMSHVMLGRSRWASGALEGVIFPSATPVEAARSMVRTAVEEIRADVLAATALGITVSVTVDGESRPCRPGDLLGHDAYRRKLTAVVDGNVYPGWPDTVQRYRTRQISLDQMWKRIGQATDQVLTLLAHCEAETHFTEESTVFDGSIAEHPGVKLYLQPTWDPIMETLAAQGLLPEFAATRLAEVELLDVAEAAVIALWKRLGLTMDIREDRQYAIWVHEPER